MCFSWNVRSTHEAILPSVFLSLFSSAGVLYYPKAHSQSAPVLKIPVKFVFYHVMQVFVSIGDELKFKVFFNHDNLDIVWSDVSSFNHSSHGILGEYLALVVR